MKYRIIAPQIKRNIAAGLFLAIGLCALSFGLSAQKDEAMHLLLASHSESEPSLIVENKLKAEQITSDKASKCFIVVGAFEVKANADRKVKYLANKGLKDLYRGTHNGKEYLGVPIDCDTPAIEDYLRDFQYRYIADAWIFTLAKEQ